MVSVLTYLKQTKNSLIGNPTAKLALQHQGSIASIVDYLNVTPETPECLGEPTNEIRTEAAHVIASLAYGAPTALQPMYWQGHLLTRIKHIGSSQTLQSLLVARAHDAILWALSELPQGDAPALRQALTRALRALVAAYAEVVGPPLWGIGEEHAELRNEMLPALDGLFETPSIDLYLSLLEQPSKAIKIAICQLLAYGVRTSENRLAITEWVPQEERVKESKGKRGWEKPGVANASSSEKLGGWVTRHLSDMVQTRDLKLLEAVLLAIAALARENPPVSEALSKPKSNRETSSALDTALLLSKSRHCDVQLAACLCATRIIRASNPIHSASNNMTPSWTLLHVLNGVIGNLQETSVNRMKGCFILYALIADEKEMCRAAVKANSLAKLSELIKSITPTTAGPDWGEGEPESTSRLREAALTSVGALSLFDKEIQHEIADTFELIPAILVCLSHPHVGVRYAACQCIRGLSRAVALLRTSIVDSGVGLLLFQIINKRDEDRRVSGAALAGLANIVTDFSPLRTVLIQKGLLTRLVELLASQDHTLKLNALWSVKNLTYKSTSREKASMMDDIGWETLASFLFSPDPAMQEQALNIARNIASTIPDVDMLFTGLGTERLMFSLKNALESSHEDVLCQGMRVLANIANGTAFHRSCILSNADILSCLRAGLTNIKVDTRKAAASCVKTLAKSTPYQHQELREAGIDITLRHICARGFTALPASPIVAGYPMGVEEDGEVKQAARAALYELEQPDR